MTTQRVLSFLEDFKERENFRGPDKIFYGPSQSLLSVIDSIFAVLAFKNRV